MNRAVAIERYLCKVFKPVGDELGSIVFGRDVGSVDGRYVMSVEGFVPVDKEDSIKRIKRIFQQREYRWEWTPLPTFYPAA